MKMNSFNFLNLIMEGTSVHRLACALDKSVRSGGHYMGLFIPGGTSYNGLYREAPRERGTFFGLQVLKKGRDFTS